MVVLFSRLALKIWAFIILRVGNILEHNKKPALTTKPNTYTHDSHSSN